MSLRIKKHLRIPNIRARRPLKIMHRQIKIILPRPQNLKSTIISLEKRQSLLFIIHAITRWFHRVVGVLEFGERGELGSGSWVVEGLVVALREEPF